MYRVQLEPRSAVAAEANTLVDAGWKLPTHVEVDGRRYRVRARGATVQVLIRNSWRAQSLFRVYDDESLRNAVACLLKHRKPPPSELALGVPGALAERLHILESMIEKEVCAPVEAVTPRSASEHARELAALCEPSGEGCPLGVFDALDALAHAMIRQQTRRLWLHQRSAILRCAAACLLLCRTKLPLAEIARCVGLGDSTCFTRVFRRWAGCRPKQLRDFSA